MSCLENITELRLQQERTLELYKDLYDSFIAPKTPGHGGRAESGKTKDFNISTFVDGTPGRINETTYNEVPSMLNEQSSMNSTCDIPRMTSQNTTITEMWNDFSVDKYAPPVKRAQTAPAPVRKIKPRTRPRVTVPDPFYMTLREELKVPTKTKAQEEAELARIKAELEEEAECKKQFKASPVPPSTYQSRLRLIQEREENRRTRVKEQSKALTKALQKPFSFDNRATLRRSRSLSALDSEVKKKRNSGTSKFHARPMPYHMFDPETQEKVKEEEAYRQIKIKMRAEQLLADSQLPETMRRHALHYTDGKIRREMKEENEKRAHLTEEHTFQPEIKDYIPDYSLLHQQQEQELLHRQSAKPTTAVEPFNLRTEQVAAARAQLAQQATFTQPSTPPPAFRASPCLYTGVYSEASPAKPTVSSQLRDSATRQKLLAAKKKAQAEYEHELTSKLKELEIRRDITEKSKALDPSLSVKGKTQQKLKQKIEQQKEKEMEYKEKLNAMNEKLKNRPFLFERVSMERGPLEAEKALRKALTEAGVDPELIREISQYEEDSLMVS